LTGLEQNWDGDYGDAGQSRGEEYQDEERKAMLNRDDYLLGSEASTDDMVESLYGSAQSTLGVDSSVLVERLAHFVSCR
jgi:hypothetical protein